ncbi:MAG: nuclear transport factor 2 family protein [Acetobacteraceae bacterium]|nr:nuclear transport factor 2 family protein [Acetobacteraceae bacterium]
MKWLVLAAAIVAPCAAAPVSPALAQGGAGSCTGSQDECQALLKIPQSYAAAVNRKDAKGVAALYTRDGILVPEGPMVSGREAIEKDADGYLKAGLSNLNIAVDQAHVTGDTAWAVGTYSFMVLGPNATSQRVPGNWGAVYARDGNDWKLRMLTVNAIESSPSGSAANR